MPVQSGLHNLDSVRQDLLASPSERVVSVPGRELKPLTSGQRVRGFTATDIHNAKLELTERYLPPPAPLPARQIVAGRILHQQAAVSSGSVVPPASTPD